MDETKPDVPARPALARSTVLLYASPFLGIGFMQMFTNTYLLKFSTDVLGIAPVAMGVVFLISRIWDAVSDPLAGYLSDRTRSRLGRRRPWLLVGAVPVAVVYYLMWNPPAALESNGSTPALAIWMGFAVPLFFTGMTIFLVPHDSLGAELTNDYHERNWLYGVRRVCFGLGALPVFAAMSWLGSAEDPRAIAGPIALASALLTATLMLWLGFRIRERPDYQGRGASHPIRALADVARNPHARLLLFVFFSQQLSIACVMFSVAYFTEYILGAPELVGAMVGTLFLVSIASIPMWIALGRRFEKKSLILVGMVLVGLALSLLGFLSEGDEVLALVAAAIGGAASGALDVLLPSTQADIIDYDELKSGERKEGMYFATWAFASKTAIGLAGMLAGFALAASGFQPNVEQGESARTAIRLLISGVPLVCYAAGILAFRRFGLTRTRHAEICAALEAQASLRAQRLHGSRGAGVVGGVGG